MHHRREIQSLAMHRRIAAMLERDPDAVLAKAMHNLRAWMKDQRDGEPVAVFSEWMDLLAETPPNEIAAFLVSESEHAVRMRQSSPFAGVLTPREVWPSNAAMKRHELEHLIRAAGAITGAEEIIVIGSQAILGAWPDTPESLLASREADLRFRNWWPRVKKTGSSWRKCRVME